MFFFFIRMYGWEYRLLRILLPLSWLGSWLKPERHVSEAKWMLCATYYDRWTWVPNLTIVYHVLHYNTLSYLTVIKGYFFFPLMKVWDTECHTDLKWESTLKHVKATVSSFFLRIPLYILHTNQNGHHKKSTNNKRWRGCGENRTLLHYLWEYKLVQPLWRTVWSFLKKLKLELPYHPAILLLGTYPDKTIIWKKHATQWSLQHYLLSKPRLGSNLNVHQLRNV